MTTHLTAASFLTWVLGACASSVSGAQEPGDGPAEMQETERRQDTGELASLGRRIGGAWRVDFLSGAWQLDRWEWGPGGRSLRASTESSDGDGESTSGVCRVLYWHPGREEIAVLALFSKGRLAAGRATIDGDTVTFETDFLDPALPGLQRALSLRWSFDDADAYWATLREADDDESISLAAWDFVRGSEPAESSRRADAAMPELSPSMKGLEPYVGRTWEAQGAWDGEIASVLRTTVERVPHADAIFLRTVALVEGREPARLLDGYVYVHPASGSLRGLVLSDRGGVFEGEVEVLDGGALQFDLRGAFDDRETAALVARLDLEPDGALRPRVWSHAGAEPELQLDLRLASREGAHALRAVVAPEVP